MVQKQYKTSSKIILVGFRRDTYGFFGPQSLESHLPSWISNSTTTQLQLNYDSPLVISCCQVEEILQTYHRNDGRNELPLTVDPYTLEIPWVNSTEGGDWNMAGWWLSNGTRPGYDCYIAMV